MTELEHRAYANAVLVAHGAEFDDQTDDDESDDDEFEDDEEDSDSDDDEEEADPM